MNILPHTVSGSFISMMFYTASTWYYIYYHIILLLWYNLVVYALWYSITSIIHVSYHTYVHTVTAISLDSDNESFLLSIVSGFIANSVRFSSCNWVRILVFFGLFIVRMASLEAQNAKIKAKTVELEAQVQQLPALKAKSTRLQEVESRLPELELKALKSEKVDGLVSEVAKLASCIGPVMTFIGWKKSGILLFSLGLGSNRSWRQRKRDWGARPFELTDFWPKWTISRPKSRWERLCIVIKQEKQSEVEKSIASELELKDIVRRCNDDIASYKTAVMEVGTLIVRNVQLETEARKNRITAVEEKEKARLATNRYFCRTWICDLLF